MVIVHNNDKNHDGIDLSNSNNAYNETWNNTNNSKIIIVKTEEY